MRCSLRVCLHTDEYKRRLHARTDLCRWNPKVFRAECDIIRNHRCNELIVGVLEHHADLLTDVPSPRLVLRIPSAHPTRSLAREEKGVQMPCKGRLARTVCPEHRHEFARCNGEGDTAQCLMPLPLSALVDMGDMIEFKKILCHLRSL